MPGWVWEPADITSQYLGDWVTPSGGAGPYSNGYAQNYVFYETLTNNNSASLQTCLNNIVTSPRANNGKVLDIQPSITVTYGNTWASDGDLLCIDSPTLLMCQQMCCGMPSCVGALWWLGSDGNGQTVGSCTSGSSCCFLKYGPHQAHKALTDAGLGIGGNSASFMLNNATSTTYATNLSSISPTIGKLSSSPIGGLGTGGFELRADGTFEMIALKHNGPPTEARLSHVDTMVLGLKVNTSPAKLLRTASPVLQQPYTNLNYQFPTLSQIKYQGAFPVSRLDITDYSFPMSVYAYGHIKPGDLDNSNTPAAVFSLWMNNTTPFAQNVSFFMSMPMGGDPNHDRSASGRAQTSALTVFDATACLIACTAAETTTPGSCTNWAFNYLATGDGFLGSYNCILYPDWYMEFSKAGNNYYTGLPGSFSLNATDNTLSFVNKAQKCTQSCGSVTLGTVTETNQLINTTFAVTANLYDAFQSFDTTGKFGSIVNSTGIHGSISVAQSIPAGFVGVIHITLSWFYPTMRWVSAAGEGAGFSNLTVHYANKFTSSHDVSLSLNPVRRLTDTLLIHQLFSNTTFPDPNFVDFSINQFHNSYMGMYFADGKWRQHECPAAANVDSVHNDYQRHLPALWFHPQSEINKLDKWLSQINVPGVTFTTFTSGGGGGAQPIVWQDQVPEQIAHYSAGGGGNLQAPLFDVQVQGRLMFDVQAAIVLEIYEFYIHSNNTAMLNKHYAELARMYTTIVYNNTLTYLPSSTTGFTQTTLNAPTFSANFSGLLKCEVYYSSYDNFNFIYYFNLYDNVFFMAMSAAMIQMATVMNDPQTVALASSTMGLTQLSIENWFWKESLGYYVCQLTPLTGNTINSMPNPPTTDICLFSDTFQGQTVALTLGLGFLLTNHTRLLSHFAAQKLYNSNPFGHLSVSQRYNDTSDRQSTDSQMWATGPVNYVTHQMWMYWSDNTSIALDTKPLPEFMNGFVNIRDNVKDMWNYPGSVDVHTGAGNFLSHYAFHMLGYHIWQAWTHQKTNMVTGTISLNPAVSPQIGVFPIFFPGSGGLVTVNSTTLTIAMNFGSVNLTSMTFGTGRRIWQFPLVSITPLTSPLFVLVF